MVRVRLERIGVGQRYGLDIFHQNTRKVSTIDIIIHVSPFYFVAENKKKEASCAANPMWTANDVEYWEGLRFTQIVALHSELVGLSVQGHLHQWRWADSHPYRHFEVIFRLAKCFQTLI